VALRESWSHVEKGMTQAEITGLLGAPSRELTIDGKLVWYYYYAGIGGSSVFFNGDGRVSSKQRPTVGWW
jgi:outer membrane protein assembly factor BamE (lipoprotein component of BamABCDE complex)